MLCPNTVISTSPVQTHLKLAIYEVALITFIDKETEAQGGETQGHQPVRGRIHCSGSEPPQHTASLGILNPFKLESRIWTPRSPGMHERSPSHKVGQMASLTRRI